MSATVNRKSAARRSAATSDSSPRSMPWWQRDLVLALAVFVLALTVFANSLTNDYVFDDVGVIYANPHLGWPPDLKTIFTTDYWGEKLTNSRLYRPLTILSFAFDWAVFGKDPPTGIHAMNVLANAAIAVLVYALVRRLWGRRDLAVLTAALYAIHPVHTEVVANGVGRSELYMAVALLIAIHLHVTFAARLFAPADGPPGKANRRAASGVHTPRAFPYLAGAAALYFAALLFKESAVVLPALVFIIDWLVLRRGRLPTVKHLASYLAYAPPLLAYVGVRWAVIGPNMPAAQEVILGATQWQRFLFASETLLRYLGQLTLPIWLCGEYADFLHLIRPTVTQPLVLASLLAWPVGAGLVFWLARRGSYVVLTGIAWFFVSILPVSNLVVTVGTIRADRLLFLPSLGFVLILAWALLRLAGAHRKLAVILSLCILAFYSVRSIDRNRDWRNQDAFWEKTVRQNPGSAVAWLAVGHQRNVRNEYASAAEAYQRAYQLRDGAGFFYADAHLNRAQMLKSLGDVPGAIEEYRVVLNRDPRQKAALINLGEMTFRDPTLRAESLDLFKRYVTEEPRDFRGHANLAQACKHSADYPRALAEIDQALSLQSEQGVEYGRLLIVKSDILRLSGDLEESEHVRQVGERLRGGGRPG